MNASRRVTLLFCAIFAVLFFGAQRASAQCVSLTTLGAATGQNFNGLTSTPANNIAWTDNSTVAGWYSTRTTFNAGIGNSNAGALWDFGVAGAGLVTDRALGGIGSGGTGTFYYAGCFTNNTGSVLTSVDITYVGEQWRDGGAAIPVAQTMAVEYQVAAAGVITDADTPTTGWTAAAALDFTSPTFTNTGAGVQLDGNAAANRTAKAATITVSVPIGQQFWIRYRDLNDGGNDHGLAVDDFFITPQAAAGNAAIVPTCAGPLVTNFGTATSGPVSATDADGTVISATITGITPSDPGTITLTGFTPAGGVGGTANATLSVSAATPANTYSVTIQWANNDGVPQTANCVVGVTVNPPPTITFIHDVQGNGAATPIPGSTVTVEGVVVGDFQNSNQLSGFFLQEEDTDANAEGNPATSEGIFIFCNTCPTPVAEGQIVQVTGVVSEFNNMTEITASTAPSVLVTNAGNNIALATPSDIDLPIAGVVNDFYEAREGMRVHFIDPLIVSEYFELPRFGHLELFEGGRPLQYTETNPPSAAGNAAYLAALDRRRVILDDDNNNQNGNLTPFQPDGMQFVYHPRANGGFSVGTQGTDFFRGGDQITSLTGVLHWSFPGVAPDTWRIRPTSATPATFTVNNPRPATPPAVGGAIKAAGLNLLNYFTTIDTTSSNNSGPCGPAADQDCRGADSAAELTRQRARASLVLCTINADVYGLMELENTTATGTINDLLGAVNAQCGGAHPYAFVNTGGTLGTDAIRVAEIYRTGVLSPVGSPLVDMDPVHNRPPTAQTFDVVDATNPAFGKRFTVIANHFKSKGCGGASGADLDSGDGQGCFAATRTAQANRLITWINSTVVPAAGDPDVLLLGDFNSYAQETPTTTITSNGFTDVSTALLGAAGAYSYLFDAQLGHLDYAFASASLLPQITGVGPWHINADEADLFDYNDEVKDTGEAAFEEKPDGSALVPPRVVFQPGSVYRAADHDPVTLGIFAISDLVVTKTDSPDPVNAGSNLTYTITVTNNGPDAAANASWSDTLPAGTAFVSMPAIAGWSCTTPAVGAGGTINCSNPSFAVGSSVFTLTVNVAPTVASGTVLTNNATATSTSAEGNPGDETGTATTTVSASADLQISKTDSPDPVNAGSNLTYQITLTNNGPSNAAAASFSDTLPAGTTFVSLSTTGPWSCTTPAVGATGTVSCTNASFGVTVDFFTLVVAVDPATAAGTVLSNTATLSSTTSDPNPGNESATATTTVAGSADLSVTKTDTPDPVNAGNQITYTVTVTNAGPSNATSVTLTDTTPAGTTFAFLAAPGAWVCPVPPSGGPVVCTHTSLPVGTSVFTIKVIVDPATAAGTVLTNNVTVTSASDPNSGNDADSATTTVATSADVSVTKVDTPDPVTAGNNLTYTITVNNAGPSNASTVALADTLPAGTTFVSLANPGWSCTTPAVGGTGTVNCSIATLAPGSAVFTLVVNVNASTASGTVLSNTATATSTTSDPNPGNESGTATTTVATSADLSVTKVDTPDPVTAGNNLTYTITLNNAGPSDASTVSLTDTVPANTTFVSLSSPGGWSCTTPAVGGTGLITCTNPTVTAGNAVFTLVVNVNAATLAGTVITNTATVTSTTSDPSAGNESGTATTTVGSGSADLSVTKTDTPDPVSAGSSITYTITVNNAGPSAATTATLNDAVPTNTTFVSLASAAGWSCTMPAVGATGPISCNIASMPVGSAVFTLTVLVDPSTANGTVITNSAIAASATTDPNPGNETGTATTTVVATSADLSVTKTDNADPVTAGTNLTYTITVNNAGPNTANLATLSDTVPADTTFVSLTSPGGWTCTTPAVGGTGAINCSNPGMTVGSAVFTLVVAVDANAGGGTILTNTATAASTTIDPNTGNESDTETTNVISPATLTATKAVTGGTRTPGGTVTYTVTINNAGPAMQGDNPGNEMTDVLPSQLTLVSASASSGTAVANVGTNTVTWNGSIPAGGSVTITIQALVNVGVPVGTSISNQATISYDADGNGTNEATATTDDTTQPGGTDPTVFAVVAANANVAGVPALDGFGLAALAALLAAIGLVVARRA